MTGNIIGEDFNSRVVDEINLRQKIHGSGFQRNRTPEEIQFLNNRNAWLKMASSVYVIGDQTSKDFKYQEEDNEIKFFNTDVNKDGIFDGVERLKQIGITDPQNFVGNQLAQRGILFNTLSEAQFNAAGKFERYNFRSGVTKTNSLWNNSSYGLGGSNFGLSPAPGLLEASVRCINRGSIREADVTLKAFNKFQFELIELLYLRLGFSIMLEWGFDKYIDQETGKIQRVGNTIIEDLWFKNAEGTNSALYQSIESYRQDYQFNYDGFYGKVANFDWAFNADGTYDISLKLITKGDVIESLTARNKVLSITPEDIEDDIARQSGVFTIDTGVGEIPDSNIVGVAGDSKLGLKMYELVRDFPWADRKEEERDKANRVIKAGSVKGSYFSWENSREYYDGLSLDRDQDNFPALELPDYNYFMTFGQLLKFCRDLLCPVINKEIPEPVLQFEVNEDTNICSVYPNMISLDPKVCIIKPKIFQTTDSTIEELVYPGYLNDLRDFSFNDGDCHYGKIMNIYINFEYIAEILSDTNEEGKLSIFEFLKKITTGINKALGNVVNLEPIIKDDITVTIIDQNPIPNLLPPTKASFELFGYNTTTSGSISNFVSDINFKSKITPDLATQITIGATAGGGSAKNYDATAFSKWNLGLIDRQNPAFNDSMGVPDGTNAGTTEQDEAWDNGRPVGSFTKKLNIFISGNQDQESELEENKTVKYKGVKIRNVEYSTFLTIAQGIDYAEKVKEGIDAAIDIAKDIYGITALQNFLYDEAEQYATNFDLYLVRAFGGKCNVTTDKKNTKSITVKTRNALYTQLSDDFVSQGHQAFKAFVNLQNQKIFADTQQPSPQIGFIPLDFGLTCEGLSGIKIYNGFESKQQFLPYQYDNAVRFIITKVDHNISENNWTTTLGTLSVPKIDPVKKSSPFFGKKAADEGSRIKLVVNSGPIDPLGINDTSGLLSDDPLKIIDNRTTRGVPENSDTFGKEISIETAVSYMNVNAQDRFRNFYNSLLNGGYDDYVIKINAVYRTFQRSVELKAENSKNASPGRSVHNYAAGVDFNVIDPTGKMFKKTERNPWIEQGIVDVATKSGLQWGGNFAGYVDSVHFFVNFDRDVALQNAENDNQGKPQRDWDTQNTDLT